MNSIFLRIQKLLTGDGLHSILAREASGATAVRFGAVGMTFLMHLVLARVLKLESYGILVYAEAHILILSIIAKAGLDNVLIKYIPSYFQEGNWSMLRGLIYRTLLWSLSLSALIMVVAAGVVSCFVEAGALKSAFLLSLLTLPFHVLNGLLSAAVRATGNAVFAILPMTLLRPFVAIIAAIAGSRLMGGELEAWHGVVFLLLGLAAAFVVDLVLAVRFLWSKIPVSVVRCRTREWGMLGLNAWFVSAFELALHQTDIVMVGMMLGMKAAGIYSVGVRLSRIILFGHGGIIEIATPLFAGLHAQGSTDRIQGMIRVAGRGILLYSLPIALLILAAGPWFLGLFGVAFSEGYSVLVVLVIARLTTAITGPSQHLLMMTSHEAIVRRLLGILFLANIVSNYCLIVGLGISGAALSTLLVTVCWKGVLTFEVNKRLGINMLLGLRGGRSGCP